MADINDWMRGNGTDALQGSTNASLIDDYVTGYLQDPLGNLLFNYREGCMVEYASASTVTIGTGALCLRNSGDTIQRFRRNTSAVTLDITTDLDTGSEQVSQMYYVYAVGDADATTFTGIISESATFPTGVTYARKIGYFYNDASGNISTVGNIGGNARNRSYIQQTADIPSTTPGSAVWADIPEMSLRFISSGQPGLVTLVLPLKVYGYGWVQVLEGTTRIGGGMVTLNGASATAAANQIVVIFPYNFTAGAVTIKAQIKLASSAYNYENSITTDGLCTLMVEEG